MTYPGGKGHLWRQISSLMPPHETYIESHLGGGSILRSKRPARTNIGVDIDPTVIDSAYGWGLNNIKLIRSDALEYLQTYSFIGNELVYADPPYPASSKSNRRYYKYEYTDWDHSNLLDTLLELNATVMISGYAHPQYEKKLSSWHRKELLNATRNGSKREFLWTNFDTTEDLHDYTHVGNSAQDRQRLRRKAERWATRIASMEAQERRVVLKSILQSTENDWGFLIKELQDILNPPL